MRLMKSLGFTFVGFLCASFGVAVMMSDAQPGTEAVRWPAIPLIGVGLFCAAFAVYWFALWVRGAALFVKEYAGRTYETFLPLCKPANRWRLAEYLSRRVAIAASLYVAGRLFSLCFYSPVHTEWLHDVTLPASAIIVSQQAFPTREGTSVFLLPKRDLNSFITQLKPGAVKNNMGWPFGFPEGDTWQRNDGLRRLYICQGNEVCVLYVVVEPETTGQVRVTLNSQWLD